GKAGIGDKLLAFRCRVRARTPGEKTMPSVTEDRDEIRQLMYRYGHTWDNLDAQGWADVFTEDGIYWEGGGPVIKGRYELIAYAQDTAPRFSGRFHIVT